MPHAKSLVLKRALNKRGGLNLKRAYRDVKKGVKKGVRFAGRHKGKIAAGALAAGAVAMGAPYALPALKTAGGALAVKAGDVAGDLAQKYVKEAPKALAQVAKTEVKKGVANLVQEGGKGLQGEIVKFASKGAGQTLIESVGGKDNFEKIIDQILNDTKENVQKAMAKEEKKRKMDKKKKVIKEKEADVEEDDSMIPKVMAQELPKQMQQDREIPEVRG